LRQQNIVPEEDEEARPHRQKPTVTNKFNDCVLIFWLAHSQNKITSSKFKTAI
jgi:hypothetical protein